MSENEVKYEERAENHIWVDVKVGDQIYACEWCITNVWFRAPVYIGEKVLVRKGDMEIGEGEVVGFFDKKGPFKWNEIYNAKDIPVMLNGQDYIWATVSNSDIFEADVIETIWKRVDDETPKPIKVGDIIQYARKDGYGQSTGRVIAVGPAAVPFTFNEKFARWGEPYIEKKGPPVSSFASGVDDLLRVVDKKD